MRSRVAITDEWGLKIEKRVLSESDFQIVYVPFKMNSSEKELIENFKGFDYIINGRNIWTANIFKQLKGKLKMFVKPGVGIDSVDIESATENGIAVSNTPGANSRAVAEFALSLMLSIATRVPVCNEKMKNGIWEYPPHRFTMIDKVVGLVGFGNIAKNLARLLSGFPVDIIAYDIFHDNQKAKSLGVKYVNLDILARKSDFISIHVPLNSTTKGIIGKKFINLMKKSSYIINTSRGGIVNTADVIDALENGEIAGFATDVFEKEPLESESKLRTLENVIITPHMAGATVEATISALHQSLLNIKEFENGNPCNVINKNYYNYL